MGAKIFGGQGGLHLRSLAASIVAGARSSPILYQEESQGLIEYSLLCALIALACVAGVQIVAQEVNSAFSKIGSRLAALVEGTGPDGH